MLHLTSENGTALKATVTNDGTADIAVERVVITCNAHEHFTAEVVRLDDGRFVHRSLTKYKVVKIDVTLEEIDF